ELLVSGLSVELKLLVTHRCGRERAAAAGNFTLLPLYLLLKRSNLRPQEGYLRSLGRIGFQLEQLGPGCDQFVLDLGNHLQVSCRLQFWIDDTVLVAKARQHDSSFARGCLGLSDLLAGDGDCIGLGTF